MLPVTPEFAVASSERALLGPDETPALVVRTSAQGRRPVAIIQHGYGSRKEDFELVGSVLAGYGVNTVLPDASGHGERRVQGTPHPNEIRSRRFFLTVVRETAASLTAVTGWARSQPWADPRAILVGGFSMGAMAALITGTEDPLVAGIVSISGSPLMDLAQARTLGDEPIPDELAAWCREHDVAAQVHRLAGRPLLLQHGRRDDMVPVAGILRLHEAAMPHYAACPERLALMLYDTTHTITEAQIMEALVWLGQHFLTEGDVSSEATQVA
jgi:uncharacterized protein